jgi:hypothetical protein
MLPHDDTVARNRVGIRAVNGGQLISYGTNDVNNSLGPDGLMAEPVRTARSDWNYRSVCR